MNFPKVSCKVFVSAGPDPTKEYESMFIINLKPRDLVIPEESEEAFNMGNVAVSVAELREYLAGGVDYFDGRQAWFWCDEKEEAQYVKPLPSPFNNPEAYVELSWSNGDVFFDDAAQLLLNFHDKGFTERELEQFTVDQLNVIRAVKGMEQCTLRKRELIDAILNDEKSKGFKGIRVVQKTFGTTHN